MLIKSRFFDVETQYFASPADWLNFLTMFKG